MTKNSTRKVQPVKKHRLKKAGKLSTLMPAISGMKKARALRAAQILDIRIKDDAPTAEVVFGSVKVLANAPSDEVVQANVAKAQQRLATALEKIGDSGVRLNKRKDVSYFKVDPSDPSIFIRELNGSFQRGILEHGKFVALK